MKSAKEWAKGIVSLCDHPDVEEYRVDLCDGDGLLEVQCKNSKHAGFEYDVSVGIIERLVERVQADAVDRDALRELDALADEMDRQCEYGIDNPGRAYEKAIRLIRRLTKP